MKLVKFDDGMFGIRFGLIYPYRYLDLNDTQYQWCPVHHPQRFITGCRGAEDKVRKIYNLLKDKGKVCE